MSSMKHQYESQICELQQKIQTLQMVTKKLLLETNHEAQRRLYRFAAHNILAVKNVLTELMFFLG